MDKTKVLGQQVLLNDIYHASEIDEVRPKTYKVKTSTQHLISLLQVDKSSYMYYSNICRNITF